MGPVAHLLAVAPGGGDAPYLTADGKKRTATGQVSLCGASSDPRHLFKKHQDVPASMVLCRKCFG